MTRQVWWAMGAFAAASLIGSPAWAQRDPDPGVNQPDRVAWQLFISVTAYRATPGNNNALFETWASDPDTFNLNPQWPGDRPSPKALVASALGQGVRRQRALAAPAAAPPSQSCVPTAERPCIGEEVRRNRPTFDFIVQNGLYTQAGLAAAFGKPLSFPIDSIEVKADWIPVSQLQAWNGTTPDQAPSLYHINMVPTPGGATAVAMVAMHLISKQVPNWTWATFEHWKNPARCDLIGCSDSFGAVVANVPPNAQPNQGYPLCAKSGALLQLMSAAGSNAVWQNYCLKGSQTDFITSTGVTTILGNSVIEQLNAGVPVNESSCMTCHATAAFNAQGSTLGQGFSANETGAPQPAWFNGPGKFDPYPYQQSDFVWAIPACAIATGQSKSPCAPN